LKTQDCKVESEDTRIRLLPSSRVVRDVNVGSEGITEILLLMKKSSVKEVRVSISSTALISLTEGHNIGLGCELHRSKPRQCLLEP